MKEIGRLPEDVTQFGTDGLRFNSFDLNLYLSDSSDNLIARTIFERYRSLKTLKSRFGKNFILKKEFGFLKAVLDGVIIRINNSVDFFILEEVFVSRIYDVRSSNKLIIIDIGMNVGIASLFFAKNERVEKIYSFEPVTETFLLAKTNFELNPKLSSKIEMWNYGLCSGTNRSGSFIYNPNNPGSFGLVGETKFKGKGLSKIVVQLNNTYQTLSEICGNTPKTNLIAIKVDCEGAEYEIIPELMQLERKPDLLMIEWHLGRGEEIVNTLKQNGYTVLFTQSEETAGMIYAGKIMDIQ